jgi:hypothetical protein
LPADLIDAAHAHKDELRALAGGRNRRAAAVWGREDWQAFYDKVTGTLLC